MRGHHDIGGLQAGRVEPTEHDYALWEKRVDALLQLLSAPARRLMRVDELRRAPGALGEIWQVAGRPGLHSLLSDLIASRAGGP